MPRLKSIAFIMCLKYLFIVVSLIISNVVFSQQSLSGKVVDSATSLPIPNINVIVKGSSKGTTTDGGGNYRILVSQGDSLVFSAVNYTTVERVVGSSSILNVVMSSKNAQLNEVVVIGYGQRQKRDLTGSYGAVNEKEIAKSTYAAPELALQGRLAGVQISTPSGNPNARTAVRIRGVTSFTNSTNLSDGTNDPLYVIDGVPITQSGQGNPDAVVRDVRTPNNPLALISPTDIESITVLKDASAAAIYGVRAANGVVLITTKRGKGKPKIELNASYGLQNAVAEGLPLLTTKEYVQLYTEAYANNPDMQNGNPRPIGAVFGPQYDPTSPKYLGNNSTYYWVPEYFNRNAPYSNINLKLSGATENLNYYVSGDMSKMEGTLKGAFQDRYTLATNISSKISKIVEVGVMLRGVYANSANGLSSTDQAFKAPAWQPLYGNGPGGYAPSQYVDSFVRNKSTTAPYDPNNVNTPVPYFSYVNGVNTNPALLYGQQTRGNQLAGIDRSLGYNDFHNYRAIGNAYLQISPLKGLRIKGTVYGDYFNDINQSVSRWDTWLYGGTASNPYSSNIKKFDTTAIAGVSIRNRRNQSYTTEIQATYNTSFGTKHNLEVTGVANKQTWWWGMIGTTGILYTMDENRYNTSNASSLHSTGSYRKSWEGTRILIGYAGRASYRYSDKYYLDLTLRRDGSSRFAPGYRWGTFPAVAIAWRISKEKFFPANSLGWLDDLKLRGNWGKLGNELATFGWKYLAIVNPGITVPNYSTGSGNGDPLGGRNGGAYVPGFANKELSWESVTTSGVGFDAAMFQNKLNLTVEYYNRLTTGIIQQVNAPLSAGIENAIDLNVGEVVNRRLEFSAGYNMSVGRLNIGVNVNFTTLKNKVTKLYNGVNLGGGDADNVWVGTRLIISGATRSGAFFKTRQKSMPGELNTGMQKQTRALVIPPLGRSSQGTCGFVIWEEPCKRLANTIRVLTA